MSVRPWMPLWRIGTRDPWTAVKMPLKNEGNIRGNNRRFSDDRWVWMRESAWFSVCGKVPKRIFSRVIVVGGGGLSS